MSKFLVALLLPGVQTNADRLTTRCAQFNRLYFDYALLASARFVKISLRERLGSLFSVHTELTSAADSGKAPDLSHSKFSIAAFACTSNASGSFRRDSYAAALTILGCSAP